MKRLIALGCSLLLASCDTGQPSSPRPDGGLRAARSGGGGSFAFVNFELGAAPGTVCPGAAGCTNGAAEPMIRADATGAYYVSSELGVTSGTLAWKSTEAACTTRPSHRRTSSPRRPVASGPGAATPIWERRPT